MNIRKLCSELAKRERTKSQAKIQAIRSIVGHLSDIMWHDWDKNGTNGLWVTFLHNGERRAKRKKK